MIALWLLGCQEYQLQEPDPVPVAKPPGDEGDDRGSPPDWLNCTNGYLGEYTNLAADHPDMEPDEDAELIDDPTKLDWWDDPSFNRFDASLDIGANYWPIDEGFEGDPAYFAVKWRAWIRAWSNTQMEFTYGAADDSWVMLDGSPIAELPGVKPFETEVMTVNLSAGQYPLEVLYAHRSGDSGFRFRIFRGDVTLCYPEYDTGEDTGEEEE